MSSPCACKPCGCRNLPSGPESCTACAPRARVPLALVTVGAAVGALAVAGMVAKRGSVARGGFPELLCTCGMPESMHGPLEHAFDPAPDRVPENPVGKTYGGGRAVSARDLRRYGMSDREIREIQQRGSRASEAPLGLDRHPFASYALAREMLDDLGWVETARSVPRGWKRPETVEFFNTYIGGVGRLVAETDEPKTGSYEFFGPENWVGRVLKKRYTEPGDLSGSLSRSRADKKAAKAAQFAGVPGSIRDARVLVTSPSRQQGCFIEEPHAWRVRVFDQGSVARVMVADDDDLYIERDVPMSEALEIFDLLVGSGPLSMRDVRDAMGLSSRRGPKGGSRSTSFSVSGKPGKAAHPWFTFSDWQSSDHTDKAAARVLSGIVGFDVAKRYAEPGVDPWFLDDEMEGAILRRYGRPPAYPESGPSIGRRPYRG